ncbi:MAG TPA: M56 family metallopeptidase, partial [Flavobacterium sp.]
MEAVFIYLIKSGALIATFWLAYFLLLRQETFFKSNRWYLLFGLVTSVILPLVTFKKVILVEANPDNLHWAPFPGEVIAAEQAFEINWWLVAAVAYSIGIAAFLSRFFFDFYALRKALRGKRVTQQADFKFVDTNENISPFSYFSYIVYNSSLYSPMELQNILEHEKVHSDQNHSVDVLISRIFCIVFWFNPFVWLYKKSMLQNLEFIADSEATKNLLDKKAYQFTLLKVTAHENCVDITNHFYQSLIKKRIVMLNKNQSKKWNSWKYALVIPALAAFMFYFQVKINAQEKATPPPPAAQAAPQQPDVRVVVNKNTSDAEMKQEAERVKKVHGVTLKFSKVKRNSAGEIIGIKMEFKDENGKKGLTQIVDNEPIKPITFFKDHSGAMGFGQANNVRVFRNRDNASDGDDDRVVYISSGDEDEDFDFDFDFDIDMPEPPMPP